jgi:hypothetical protein
MLIRKLSLLKVFHDGSGFYNNLPARHRDFRDNIRGFCALIFS